VVDPRQTRRIADSSKKIDRIDAKKLGNLLRVGMVAESCVPPPANRKRRTHEIHALLDQNGIRYDGLLWDEDGL
jgi:hypothetical protein